MIKLVLIDFDDTLSLTEQARFKAENSTAENMGFLPMTREAHLKNWGKPLEEAIVERIPGMDSAAFMEEFEKAIHMFQEKGEIDIVTDLNLQTLDNIRAKGIKTAILTSRTLREASHLVDTKHPISTRIDAFYHKDNTGYMKPHPKVYDKALQQFEVKPEEAVYVGDSLGDGVSAKEAGMHFIALLESGIRTEEDFKSVPVDYFALRFEDILKYLEKVNYK